MITIVGKEILRAGQRIGYLQGNDIFSHANIKLGYVQGNHIFVHENHKLAWLENDYIKTADGQSIRVEANNQQITGGEISDIQRAAIRFLLGV